MNDIECSSLIQSENENDESGKREREQNPCVKRDRKLALTDVELLCVCVCKEEKQAVFWDSSLLYIDVFDDKANCVPY